MCQDRRIIRFTDDTQYVLPQSFGSKIGMRPSQEFGQKVVSDSLGRESSHFDSVTGKFKQPDPGGYSPAALVFFDFTRRLRSLRSALPTQ
ncbi:MAG TPA: hypothetical protein VMF91_27160 [Bryobacteraceae bacterium]|nr:hypothetical protein [Bryobacteraceae bacterium]